MTSPFCQQNPFSYNCISNPNYTPAGTTFNLPNVIGAQAPSTSLPSSWEIFNLPIGGTVPSRVPTQPKVLTNAGGVAISSGQTTLDKFLATFLSAFALHKNASYVPTSVQPANDSYGGAVSPEMLAYLQQQQGGIGGGNNFFGRVENWVKNNTGVTVLIVGGVALYLTKSPRK